MPKYQTHDEKLITKGQHALVLSLKLIVKYLLPLYIKIVSLDGLKLLSMQKLMWPVFGNMNL
ncbi:hypothetical protein B0W48_12800 [Pseudoalteromonas aliena]|uniref:Uncharacterized protein n=1 Tax=Pseudoalteromonas aliena TaxID=247523 RepID=A0A1Q2GZT0_9GAMM|nr:hypothetical protein B0W48_12800 [Pseudoalteromonas aliena]